jgi:predicted transport protein
VADFRFLRLDFYVSIIVPLDKSHLLSLCARVVTLKSKNLNEEDTRVILIDPMLLALGWNIFDLNEISRNCKTSSGGYVDYILKNNGTQIYLEAKPLISKLEQKFQIQATNYAYEDNIDICVLTNGNHYQIFKTFKRGTVSDRLLIDICLDDEKISLDKKVEYLNFISKENIKTGVLECDKKKLSCQQDVVCKNESDIMPELINLFLTLKEKILALGKDIREVFYHQHKALGFRQGTEFAVMKINPKSKEIEIILKFGNFRPDFKKLDNMSIQPLPKTHVNGNNNYKVRITSIKQIKQVLEIVRQSYNLKLKYKN